MTSSVYLFRDSSGEDCSTPSPNGDRYGTLCFFRGGVLRPVRLLQPARILVPRVRQRENQERDRAEHEPPCPRGAREEDSREISQQPNEAQENQELLVLTPSPRRLQVTVCLWRFSEKCLYCLCFIFFGNNRPLCEKKKQQPPARIFDYSDPAD